MSRPKDVIAEIHGRARDAGQSAPATETPETLRAMAGDSDELARARPDDARAYEQQAAELRARADELERRQICGRCGQIRDEHYEAGGIEYCDISCEPPRTFRRARYNDLCLASLRVAQEHATTLERCATLETALREMVAQVDAGTRMISMKAAREALASLPTPGPTTCDKCGGWRDGSRPECVCGPDATPDIGDLDRNLTKWEHPCGECPTPGQAAQIAYGQSSLVTPPDHAAEIAAIRETAQREGWER